MSAEPAAIKAFAGPGDNGSAEISEIVQSYLRRMQFQDGALIERLAAECIERARRVAKQESGELARRAIEEVQQRLDQALARALGVHASREPALIAGARAALLLGNPGVSADELYLNTAVNPELASRLQLRRPLAQPLEAPVAMAPQKLRFFLFKSA